MPGLPLFIYGTLQDHDVLEAVLGRAGAQGLLQPAGAPHFIAVTYPGQVYPALIRKEGKVAPGYLLPGLDALDWAVLDAFEGEDYRREEIAVQADSGSLRAFAYLPTRNIAPDAPVWTFEMWIAGHKPAVLETETALARALRARLSGHKRGED